MKINLTQFICKSSVIAAFALTAASAYSQNFIVAGGTSVRTYSSSGTFIGTFATGFGNSIGIAEGGGNVFISDLNGSVSKFSPSGTNLGLVNSNLLNGPAGLAWANGRINSSGNGNGFVMSSEPDALMEDGDPATPAPYLFFNGAGNSPTGMTSAGPNGFPGVYYNTVNNANNSSFLNYWVPGVSATNDIISFGINTRASGLVADGAGNLYIALFQAGEIWRRDIAGNVTTWKTGVNSPVGLAIDGGNLFVSSFQGQSITAYDLVTGTQGASFATGAGTQYFIITAIPEPSTYALLGLAGIAGLIISRRRARIA